MKSEEQKIIFLNSYLPRTGHNFSSQVIKVFSNHKVLTNPHSEICLSRILDIYYTFSENNISYKSAKDFMDKLFIKDLRENIIRESEEEFVMIKDTSVIGTKYLLQVFPNDLHFILIRDPKGVFNSLIKGMNLRKRNFKNLLKKAGNKTGLYPWYYSRKLSKQILNEIPDLKTHRIIRYEDLVMQKEETLKCLQELFNTQKSLNQIKKEIDEIKVINSSFFEEVKAKKIWDAQPKTPNFDPVNRKGNSWLIRKGIEIGSRKLRKKLNYI